MPISFVNTNKDPNRFNDAHRARMAAEAVPEEQTADILMKMEAVKLENLRLTGEVRSLAKMVENLRTELARLTDDNAMLRGLEESPDGR